MLDQAATEVVSEHTLGVVRNHQCVVAILKKRHDAVVPRAPLDHRSRCQILVIDPYELLLSGEHTSFGGGGPAANHVDALDAYTRETEQFPQSSAGLVVTGPPGNIGMNTESGQIQRNVARTTDRHRLASEPHHTPIVRALVQEQRLARRHRVRVDP